MLGITLTAFLKPFTYTSQTLHVPLAGSLSFVTLTVTDPVLENENER